MFEDLNQHNRFVWTEWWPDAAYVQASIDSDGFRALIAAARVLGRLESVRLLDIREADAPERSRAHGDPDVSPDPSATRGLSS